MMRRGIGRVGRPSLVGTMARTAVIAGTATAVSNKVSQGQAAKAQQAADAQAYQAEQQQAAMDAAVAQQVAAQQAAAPPPPPLRRPPPAASPTRSSASSSSSPSCATQGILTEEEFSAKKAKPRCGLVPHACPRHRSGGYLSSGGGSLVTRGRRRMR